MAGSAVSRREEETGRSVCVWLSVGVRGGLEEGSTGRSSSTICGVGEMVADSDEEGGCPRISERTCSVSRSSSRKRSKFSLRGRGEGEWKEIQREGRGRTRVRGVHISSLNGATLLSIFIPYKKHMFWAAK